MLLRALPDDFKLNAGTSMTLLSALPDDFKLNALGDTERSAGLSLVLQYFMVDSSGNFMVDSSGNFMVALDYGFVYPQMLHALPDDFKLNAE